MKISGLEKCAILLTLVCLIFSAGYFLGQNNGAEPYTVTAQTQWSRPVGETAVQTDSQKTDQDLEPAPTPAVEQTPSLEPDLAAAPAPTPAAEEVSPGPALAEQPSAGQKININTADAAELDSLPGIGAKRAADIVADREANGPFRIPEDITRVSGIGEGILNQIIDQITVE